MRFLFPASFAVAVALLAPLPAAAQNAYVSTELNVFINGENQEAPPVLYLNKNECDNNVEVEFRVVSLKTIPAFLEVWTASSSATSCDTTSAREVSTSTSGTTCRKVTTITSPTMTGERIKVHAQDLFDKTDKKTCTETGNQAVYILGVPNETPDNATQGSAPTVSIGYKVTFNVDVTPPSVPTSVDGRSGESSIGVTWSESGKTTDFNGYLIYYDADGVAPAGSACSSDLLVAGEAPPSSGDIDPESSKSGSSSVSPDSVGLAIGEQIPIAVSTQDKAGNKSDLSEVVCVERVQTAGFWDQCEATKSCKDDFETCALSPGHNRSAWLGMGLAALGLLLAARRRRNV